MSSPSHYDITVSKRDPRYNATGQGLTYHHYFTTTLPSHYSSGKAAEVLKDLRTRFPTERGFKVEAIHWYCVGHPVDLVPKIEDDDRPNLERKDRP